MKHIITISLILAGLALPLAAQILPSSPVDPVIDGSFGATEYPQVVQLKDMRLGYALSRNGQSLHFILEAPATGWVSVGLGSNRMHGAHMIIGYDALSSQVISEETGRGHGHSPSSTKLLIQSTIKESGGKTTLEFSLPASTYSSGKELPLIVAYGTQDNLRSKHKRYDSHTIAFQK
ncbi:MAG: DOMON domain-containing protein [Sphaerochaeta sp.]|jgi:hypothetical protein|nr:DOMON domain-containing protein [Sphaerochaeta sp.]NCC91115.1 hypothetical protein [Spirochaetia bacterium]